MQYSVESGYPSDKDYPSYVSSNSFGKTLRASKDLSSGTIVATFTTIPHDKEFRAGLEESLEHCHVICNGRDICGNNIWCRVISNGAYCNHSCDPNCEVNDDIIMTIRPVEVHEELTIAYDKPNGSDYWPETWNFACLCGSNKCRKYINSYKNI